MTDSKTLARLRSTESTRFIAGRDGQDLLIVFSSRPAGMNRKQFFSYDKTVTDARFDRLLLRDPLGQWFLRGLPGLTESFDGIVDLLNALIAENSYRRVIVIGISGGTLAAVLTGARVPVAGVICVCCRVSQTREHRARDTRVGSDVHQSLDKLWAELGDDHPYLDAATVLSAPGSLKPKVHLYYDPEFRKDTRSAATLTPLPFVRSFHFPGVGHDPNTLSESIFAQDPLLGGQAVYKKPTKDKKDYRAGGLARGLAAARARRA